MNLADVVHGAIADNKYLLRQCDMAITVDGLEQVVYADDKWVRFILDQIVSNAVKYRAPQQPALGSLRSGRMIGYSCPLRTMGSASRRATCRGSSRRALPARTGGPSTVPPGSVCISASACATSWDSAWRHPQPAEGPRSPFPSISTTSLQECRADRLCTSYIFVRTSKEKLIQKRPHGR